MVMLSQKIKLGKIMLEEAIGSMVLARSYSSQVYSRELQTIIQMRVENRAKNYPVDPMTPVANEVLEARTHLIQGVSRLLKVIPIVSCKFCSEVFVGEKGHLIRSCWGYKRISRQREHEWVPGGLSDILVTIDTVHHPNPFLNTKNQRFNFGHVPAVVELCWQAGVEPNPEVLHHASRGPEIDSGDVFECLSREDLRSRAVGTLKAWETVREGVEKLLCVHPAKVCKQCSEVHVGRRRHKAWQHRDHKGKGHLWKKAGVDDLVPPKIVWRRRRHDPEVLMHENQNYYGHSPAVVDLCTQAGAIPPAKYFCMMKVNGLSEPVVAPVC